MSVTEPVWRETTLGEICQINPPKPKLGNHSDDVPVGFVPMSAVDDVTGEILAAEHRPLGEVRSKSYRTFSSGDVIFAKITPCMENGKSAVVPELPSGLGFGSTEFHVLRPRHDVSARFIWHFVRQESFRRVARQNMTGSVGQARVPVDFLRAFPIDLPPRDVQEQIATILDSATSAVHSARSRLDAARLIIERFRQAVLAAACSGRLTADWREANEPADKGEILAALAERRARVVRRPATSVVGAAEEEFDIPATWATTSLDSISIRITSGSRDWSRYYGRGSGTFVMAQNIRQGHLDWSYRQAIDPPVADPSRDRSQIEAGDLLVTIVGANTGDIGPVMDNYPEHYVCQSVALVRPADARITPYLNMWFNSRAHGRAYFDSCIYGAGRPHLSFDQLKSAPIALPSLTEQEEILRRVSQLHAVADTLLPRIACAAENVDRTAQAVLAKAFRGELVGGDGESG